MKVLVSDNLGEIGIQLFQQEEGIDVDVKTGLAPEALKDIIGEYDALVIRSATKVTEDLLEAANRLKVVGRAGIGLDNVDIPAATKRGIVVMNTPGGNVVTTAEHTIAMMMALTRNIPRATASLKAEKWEKKLLQGREIFNKTLGVIGFGKIGAVVADRARGLKMRVIVFDPNVTPERIEKAGFESASLEELYQQADYITVHVPKLPKTTGLLNKAAFDQMKDGVMVLNCARGGIINQNDLYDAMQSGKVAGAALDVFETEPPGDLPLLQMDNVIATPHLGASTKEAQTNVAVAVAKQIIAYLKTGTIINAVNVSSVTGELLEKLSPYLKLADALGSIQAQLSQGPFEEIAIEYKGDFHGLDLSPVTTAIIKGFLTPLVMDDVNSVNAPIIARDMGIKVTETMTGESEDYTHLINVRVVSPKASNLVAGTIFGKNDPRIVRINKFRLELIVRKGFFVLINNYDKPGAIGSIGTVMGSNDINISRMQVGQEEGGNRTLIFIRVDQPIPEDVLESLRSLPMVISATPFEL
jgi:D-3-phosphoglycerate dehydrogenase